MGNIGEEEEQIEVVPERELEPETAPAEPSIPAEPVPVPG